MKRHYIKPIIEKVALQSTTMMTTLSVKGSEGGEARSHSFYGSFAWDEDPGEDKENNDFF